MAHLTSTAHTVLRSLRDNPELRDARSISTAPSGNDQLDETEATAGFAELVAQGLGRDEGDGWTLTDEGRSYRD